MLIVRKPDETSEGTWFDLRFRGETIRLKIRPLTGEVLERIRKKHRKITRERDPQTRQLVKVETFDDEAITADLADYVLEDFEGIGEAPDKPLEVTKENKLLVMDIPSLDGEISIADFVFEKARELAAVSTKEYEELEKN